MKPTALIVDDHPVNRQVLQAALEPIAEVRHACDGVEGLEEIHNHRPDVVFLDLMMPRLDGFGVIDALERDHDPIVSRIVVVTARSDDETRERLMAHGVHAFIGKPVVLRDIQELFTGLTRDGVREAPSAPSRAAAGNA